MSVIFKILLWVFAIVILLGIILIHNIATAIKDYVLIDLSTASLNKSGVINMTSKPSSDPRINNIAVGTQFAIYRTTVKTAGNTVTASAGGSPVLTGTIQTVAPGANGVWAITGNTNDTTYKFNTYDQVSLIL